MWMKPPQLIGQYEIVAAEVAQKALPECNIVFIEGVVPAISTAIQAFTKEGEAVLINTPVYPPFARSVKLNIVD